jgi:chemotaxis protein CheY-P-specific phosphatase CheC
VTETTIRAALAGAVADVLENMFFREAPAEATERLPREAANAIAADFLGEDTESITAQQSTDVTLELGNMICGAVLSRIESSATFRLDTPRVLLADSDEPAPGRQRGTRWKPAAAR